MVCSIRPARLAPWCLWLATPLGLPHAHATPLSTDGCHMHKAVAGDTLIAIATHELRQPSDWRTLARINRIAHPRRIPVGTPLCLPLSLLKAQPRPGVVLDVTGLVTQSPPSAGRPVSPPWDEAARPVQQGDAIPPGTRLHTGANGYVTVQLPDGSVLKVQADTDARLDTSEEVEATGSFSSTWEVLRGRVESWVKPVKDGQRRHQIRTPQATLGVRGTVFRVATDEARTLGETLSGSVAVSGLGRRLPVTTAGPRPTVNPQTGQRQGLTLLAAGEGTVTLQGHAPQAATRLPPPPDVSGLPALYERVLLRFQTAGHAGRHGLPDPGGRRRKLPARAR
ncbi:MAG: FecR domain-containing protein [Aquabacterium sp.]